MGRRRWDEENWICFERSGGFDARVQKVDGQEVGSGIREVNGCSLRERR